jgi:hypothetical protein
LKDADVYLFFDEGAQASSHVVTLGSERKKVEMWDPQTGMVKPVVVTGATGAVRVQLDLKPYETAVLIVR